MTRTYNVIRVGVREIVASFGTAGEAVAYIWQATDGLPILDRYHKFEVQIVESW
jgi:hypothetical protein